MPLPVSREDLLVRLRDAAAKLDVEFDDFADPRAADGSGVSPADRLGYQIGWGRCLLGWEEAEAAGRPVEMPAVGYSWNALGALAESFYAQYRGWSVGELRGEFAGVVEEIAGWVGSLSEDELFLKGQRVWAGEKWAVVKWVQVNTIAPYTSARTKIRAQRRAMAERS